MSVNVGIFWIFENKVFGLLERHSCNKTDSLGFIDSQFQHARDWHRALSYANLATKLADFEYEDILRGRLTYNAQRKSYIVYSDSTLLTRSLRSAVKLWANIKNHNVTWHHDIHYTLALGNRWDLLDN